MSNYNQEIEKINELEKEIEQLKAEKLELIEFISTLQEYDFETLVSEQNRLCDKYEIKP